MRIRTVSLDIREKAVQLAPAVTVLVQRRRSSEGWVLEAEPSLPDDKSCVVNLVS